MAEAFKIICRSTKSKQYLEIGCPVRLEYLIDVVRFSVENKRLIQIKYYDTSLSTTPEY
jgi:hypothetical protein